MLAGPFVYQFINFMKTVMYLRVVLYQTIFIAEISLSFLSFMSVICLGVPRSDEALKQETFPKQLSMRKIKLINANILNI